MIYTNEEYKLSIDVNEDYKMVPKKNYDTLGFDEKTKFQTLFVFIKDNDDGEPDTFNITRDAIYESDEEAMSKGIGFNKENLEKQGVIIASEQELTLANGNPAVKIIATFGEVNVNLCFFSIGGMLMCLGYINPEEDLQKEIMMENILSTVKKID